MMPSDEKRFVKLQQCFLMRNMTGHPPPILPPKKTNSIPQFRMLLPFQTSTKVSGNGKYLFYLYSSGFIGARNYTLKLYGDFVYHPTEYTV